jgi:hypothetical protein
MSGPFLEGEGFDPGPDEEDHISWDEGRNDPEIIEGDEC